MSRPTEAERILAVVPPVSFALLDKSGFTAAPLLSSGGLGDGFFGGLAPPPRPINYLFRGVEFHKSAPNNKTIEAAAYFKKLCTFKFQ